MRRGSRRARAEGTAAALGHFRRILGCNNRVLERIARMDGALGGEYVFDSAFVNESLEELKSLAREVIYSLNALSGDRYPELYERLTAVGDQLADIAAGGPGPYGRHLVLPSRIVHRDLDHLAGAKSAVLGEAANQLGLTVPDGFTVTAEAYRRCLEHGGLGGAVRRLLSRPGGGPGAEDAGKLFAGADLPGEVVKAVEAELKVLVARRPDTVRLAVRSSAVGEDGRRSFAGQFLSVIGVRPDPPAVLKAYREVLASRFAPAVLDYLGEGVSPLEFPMAVHVQVMVDADAGGVCYSKDPAAPGEERMLVSAAPGGGGDLVGGAVTADLFLVSRRHPFGLLGSEIVPRSAARRQGEPGALDMTGGGLRRGSALLTPAQLADMAEAALLLEKHFDGPQDIEWALSGGRLVILQSRRLHVPPPPPTLREEAAAALQGAEVLLRDCGHVVQTGVASGPVIHVDAVTDPADFPVGAIAVARTASPKLSPIVRRAAAVITDVGSPAGHLATIAREYRTPAIFGTGTGTSVMPAGMEVTLDGEAGEVYAGRVEGLAVIESAREDVHRQSGESRTLRRLLRWIAPLNLTDPAAPDFSAPSCRTVHDIIRFCHEKAVEHLISLPGRGRGRDLVAARRLAVTIPIAVSVIDLGGGVSPDAGPAGEIAPAQVLSRPFRALLSGLLRDEAWDREPAPFGVRDLMGSLSRPVSRFVSTPAYAGRNLAIVAPDYFNLSLRLGYHFNVIDTFLSGNLDGNYIYFRFVGGFAEKRKRERRAELIGMILSSLHFRTERKGDLLVGKVKRIDEGEMTADLALLGELVAFTRQLDVRMVDEGAVDAFFRSFLEKCRLAATGGESP